MAVDTATTIDQDKLQAAIGRVVGDYLSTMAGALIYIGDCNGLFAAMAGAGPLTPEALAEKTGQSPRYLREWLGAMTCSGHVEYDPETGAYTLTPEAAALLADPDSPVFLAGNFQMLPTFYRNASKVAEAFRTGTGVPQTEYGEEFWKGFERFTRAQFLNHLIQEWIPALDGIEDRLRAGATVADVGCGNGQALIILARAYPRSQFVGYDNYPPAVENARASVAEAGLGDRIRVEPREVVEGIPERYDLICTFDVVHDMVDPVAALRSIRQALKPGGSLLWTEFNVSDNLAENLQHPVNLGKFAYSASTLYCMTTSLAAGGAGIGTCMGHHGAADLAREAGFAHFRRLPIEDPFTQVYEARG
jgi:SAM-dependent methyltransferase